MKPQDSKIAVIGLGYVGLPLAVEFGKKFSTVGFDINIKRVQELRNGIDRTLETEVADLMAADQLSYTTDLEDLRTCNTYIVTVPSPIDRYNRPDLKPLLKASETVGKVIKQGDVVIYESTVYPGATEEDCIPVVEKISGLTFNVDFFAGYSPERINPGDKEHSLPTIKKVTSASTPASARYVDDLYKTIIIAGTHLAPSIKVAEAAKVIENTQRDVNIALVNELALIFDRLGLNTQDVLAAAGTKWNFLPFRPGLVGGHCIGVDPYYLTHKAQEVGYHPEVVLAGRRINDGMGQHVASRIICHMIKKDLAIKNARALVLGLTFKENCPDLRNTRVVDVIDELEAFGMQVDVCDPWVDADEAKAEYGVNVCDPLPGSYDCIVMAVGHDYFVEQGCATLRAMGKNHHVFYDVKSVFEASETDGRL